MVTVNLRFHAEYVERILYEFHAKDAKGRRGASLSDKIKSMTNPQNLTDEQIKEKIAQYNWYHEIQLTDTIRTPGYQPIVNDLNQWLQQRVLENIDFKDKRVLDIGCREGLYSFLAERQGAKEVIGIDNDPSNAAQEFLIPFFESNIQMNALNLYDLTPDMFGKFDVILLFGVLYHLKFPFWGLKRVTDCLKDDGILMINTGVLNEPNLKDIELVYCPGDVSGPFGYGCPTYFNQKGLVTTLQTFQLYLLKTIPFTQDLIGLQSFIFQKNEAIPNVNLQGQELNDYYYGFHNMHTQFTKEDVDKIYQQGSKDIVQHWSKLTNWKYKLK